MQSRQALERKRLLGSRDRWYVECRGVSGEGRKPGAGRGV